MGSRIALGALLLLTMLVGGTGVYINNTTGSAPLHTVTVGALPDSVAVDPMTHRAIVASDSGSISVLNTSTGALLRTISGQRSLGGTALAVDARVGRAFVCGFDGRVRVLDTRNARIVRTLSVGRGLSAVAVDARRGYAYITNPASTVIRMIDARDGVLLRTTPVGVTPTAVAVDTQTGHVFVAWGGMMVSMFDGTTGQRLHTIRAGLGLTIAVSARTQRVFVVDESTNTVDVLDARSGSLMRRTPVGLSPVAAVVSERTGHVFVANQLSRTLSILNATTGAVVATTPVTVDPIAVAVDDQRARVLAIGVDNPADRPGGSNVVNNLLYAIAAQKGFNGAVSVLDARSGVMVRTVREGQFPSAVAVDETTNHAFVTNVDGNNATMLDTRTF